ncbi:MAG: hypothetical protein ABI823_05265 [Bryobacteraceae bacterium]
MTIFRGLILATVLLGVRLLAQTPVAPTLETVGKSKGEDFSGYNVVQSFELGYRFRSVGGDLGKYRSDVNYGNGIRLLSSSLLIHSLEGHGLYFDELLLSTQGLGNDPYQFVSLRIQKNALYQYNLLWRSNDYFNPGLTISGGRHLLDTTRRLQDHDLVLLPQSSFRFFLGYSRNVQSGAGLSTIQLFDSRGDQFPLFTNIHRQTNEYRIGNEIRMFHLRLNWMRGWENFKEDSPALLAAPNPGENPADGTTLSSLQRTEPYRGHSPYWRVALFSEGRKGYEVNGRFTYTSGRRAFVQNESAIGTNRFGSDANRQILTFGDAQRPVTTANLTFSIFPASRITVTNQTSFYQIRMEGNSYYQEFNNGDGSSAILPFQFLGIRTIANTTDADIRLTNWLGFRAGYHFSSRRIRSIQGIGFEGDPPLTSAEAPLFEQDNRLHAGAFGLRIKPAKPVTILLEAEIGRSDKPFLPISEKNYQAFSGRVEYRKKTVRLAAYSRANYNTNSANLFSFSSRSRQYGADASWTANNWFSFDASYAKLHLDTEGGIVYFLNSTRTNGTSIYVSNLQTGHFGGRFSIRRRIDLYAGLSNIQDTGDGRGTPFGTTGASLPPVLLSAQTFPLRFLSPQARLSVKLHEKIRWNVGYQYYGYREEFSALQNYRAHTGYSGVLWSF